MKVLFDQNMSHRLVGQLAVEFPGSAHVIELGLDTASDTVIWAYAAANGFMIVSKDVDFQQRALLRGHPPKVIWIRLGNCSTSVVATILRVNLTAIEAFEADPSASFMTLS